MEYLYSKINEKKHAILVFIGLKKIIRHGKTVTVILLKKMKSYRVRGISVGSL